MISPFDPSKVPGASRAQSTPRVDKIDERFWSQLSPRKEPINDNPIEVVYLDSSNSTNKIALEVVTLESTPNGENPILKAEPLIANETEDHELGVATCISDINPRASLTHQIF